MGHAIYRVVVDMGVGVEPRGVVLIAPGDGLDEATRVARLQFGEESVVSVERMRDER